MIRVRVDDFPQTKGEPQHTLVAYEEFHKRLSDAIGGKRYLLGAIPGRCTDDDFQFLEESVGIEVGMHGISHDERLLDLYQNEFPPHMTRDGIRSALKQSRLTLEQMTNRPVGVYMPPRNRIDIRTIECLAAVGFHAYTTGPETPEKFRTGPHPLGMRYVHRRPPLEYGRADELLERRAHEYLTSMSVMGSSPVLTLHWTWETNIGLDHMDKFLSLIGSDMFEDFHT